MRSRRSGTHPMPWRDARHVVQAATRWRTTTRFAAEEAEPSRKSSRSREVGCSFIALSSRGLSAGNWAPIRIDAAAGRLHRLLQLLGGSRLHPEEPLQPLASALEPTGAAEAAFDRQPPRG